MLNVAYIDYEVSLLISYSEENKNFTFFLALQLKLFPLPIDVIVQM